MKITKTKIPDVLIIEPKVFGDDCGFKHPCHLEQREEFLVVVAGIKQS